MKEYQYKGYNCPIIVNEDNIITYRGKEIEKYYDGFDDKGCPSISYSQRMKVYYMGEMDKIDFEIKREEYKKMHPEEYKNLKTADESIDYFLKMLEED